MTVPFDVVDRFRTDTTTFSVCVCVTTLVVPHGHSLAAAARTCCMTCERLCSAHTHVYSQSH